MPVKPMGDHAVGMDIMHAIMKALKEAVNKLMPASKEQETAMKMMMEGNKLFQRKEGGKEDSVDPMQRVARAIAMNRQQAAQKPQGAPGQPPMPAPNRGPVPTTAGAPA